MELSRVRFTNRDIADVWALHEAAHDTARRSASLVEKRRALVFMAWLTLRCVHQTPKKARSHVTTNRRSGVRVLLRSARELRSLTQQALAGLADLRIHMVSGS